MKRLYANPCLSVCAHSVCPLLGLVGWYGLGAIGACCGLLAGYLVQTQLPQWLTGLSSRQLRSFLHRFWTHGLDGSMVHLRCGRLRMSVWRGQSGGQVAFVVHLPGVNWEDDLTEADRMHVKLTWCKVSSSLHRLFGTFFCFRLSRESPEAAAMSFIEWYLAKYHVPVEELWIRATYDKRVFWEDL